MVSSPGDIILDKPQIIDVVDILYVHAAAYAQTGHTEYVDVEPEWSVTRAEIDNFVFKEGFLERSLENAKKRILYPDDASDFTVARLHNKVVGFGVAIVTEESGYIQSLYVSPEQQNRGIGSLILSRLLDFTNSLPTRTAVLAHTPAVQFYERHGFNIQGLCTEEERLALNLSLPLRLMHMQKG